MTTGAEYAGLDRSRNTNGSMMRLMVRLNGPPSSALSTSTPGPIARHAASITDRRGCPAAAPAGTVGGCGSALISTE
ncbi:hypothetical protein MAHJHV58_30310 [Mycobacterium avium subsp. hominissuis]